MARGKQGAAEAIRALYLAGIRRYPQLMQQASRKSGTRVTLAQIAAVLKPLKQGQAAPAAKPAAKRGPGRPPKVAGAGKPAKRGPGRPPKAAVAAPAKRGPGRPPKAAGAGKSAKRGPRRPPKAAKAAGRRGPGRPPKAAAPAKRGPGRPPKSALAGTPAKRGPGRPPKAAAIAKRGLGRPPKTPAIESLVEKRRSRRAKPAAAKPATAIKPAPAARPPAAPAPVAPPAAIKDTNEIFLVAQPQGRGVRATRVIGRRALLAAVGRLAQSGAGKIEIFKKLSF